MAEPHYLKALLKKTLIRGSYGRTSFIQTLLLICRIGSLIDTKCFTS